MQATLGKNVMNLKVTDLSGNRITFIRAFFRYFGKYISTLILMIGYIMVAWTKKKQGLHDKMCGTLVIVDRQTEISQFINGNFPTTKADLRPAIEK